MNGNLSRRAFLAGSSALAALALAACGSPKEGDDDGSAAESTGSVLSVASAYAAQNYHPCTTSSSLALSANRNVVEGLYEIDFRDWSVSPGLAAKDPVQTGESTFEVTLREGATFSDGSIVTSEDVVASFARCLAEGNVFYPMVSCLASIEAKDPTTVVVTTTVPNFSLLRERLAIVRIVPAAMDDEELAVLPVGSGPWVYESIEQDMLCLRPNETYNGGHPALADELRFYPITDPNERVDAFLEGSAHIVEALPPQAFAQVKTAGCKIDTVLGFDTRLIMFDIAKAPWNDVRVRQAVMYALDYDKIVTDVFLGQAEVPTGYLPTSSGFYHKASVTYARDMEKARALLKESGVNPGSIELLATDNPQVSAIAAQVKTDLDILGFDVTVNVMEAAKVYDTIDQGGSYDLLVASGDPSRFGADPDLLMGWWFGDNAWMQTRCPWKDSDEWRELSSLMTQAAGQRGEARQATWDRCIDILAENVVLYPIVHANTCTAYWFGNGNPSDGTVVSGFSGIGTSGVSLVDCQVVNGEKGVQ